MTTSTAQQRISPALAPYGSAIDEAFARITPRGMEPLNLFRTMARNPRVLQRMFAGSLLDAGAITLRERELIILRTCARCGSEYEWGVHVKFFASRAELTAAEVAATRSAPAIADTLWHGTELLLIRLVDALHDSADVPDDLWRELEASYTAEQLLELITLTGYYHTISFLTNALRITPESYAPRFADKR
ncbi:carboxymuconolactone decarboxylase family protein [Noviherbaspirillum sp. Root189]|uniref:carboxymuconolactone decarboxylase family protein n=1 Tax=Noviherbaspirillum sp. Root189 TaxID=1736487 RepID=UPI00070BD062|nr:carboxymuconolactone decarboxylase family protein [Noviherbaspirillum sp. Root189]KRB66266.1 carboxymuconolactone decarboxylase [Noviherbaspirillum sp. Root189]